MQNSDWCNQKEAVRLPESTVLHRRLLCVGDDLLGNLSADSRVHGPAELVESGRQQADEGNDGESDNGDGEGHLR